MSEFLVSWGGGPRDGRWCLTTCLVNRAADELGMFQNIGWDGKSENVGEEEGSVMGVTRDPIPDPARTATEGGGNYAIRLIGLCWPFLEGRRRALVHCLVGVRGSRLEEWQGRGGEDWGRGQEAMRSMGEEVKAAWLRGRPHCAARSRRKGQRGTRSKGYKVKEG